jgi:TMEM175 potassium channel family protein
MTKSRLEAFSDGVIAILITIMVLELQTPRSADLSGLLEVLPTVGLYALSFVYLGIYWTNHHHLLHATTQINGTVLWANLHLLFWLSLIPFGTRWMGESGLAPLPTAAYGGVLLFSGAAYSVLVRCILACQPPNSLLASAIGDDRKGYISLVLYAVAIPLTLANAWLSVALYALVALIWLVPDRRIERRLRQAEAGRPSSAQPNGS